MRMPSAFAAAYYRQEPLIVARIMVVSLTDNATANACCDYGETILDCLFSVTTTTVCYVHALLKGRGPGGGGGGGGGGWGGGGVGVGGGGERGQPRN